MRAFIAIVVKEWKMFLDSVLGYLTLILFLLISGFFTWLFGNDILSLGQATLQPFFITAYWTLFFFIPALTMRAFAEENKLGTIEWLFTRPVQDFVIIAGKFTAVFLLIAFSLLLTLPYYVTIIVLSQKGWSGVDHGAIICGYLGLLLMSIMYISIGLFTSSLTANQVVAFLLALAFGIPFHLLFGIAANYTSGFLKDIFFWLDASSHFQSMARGVLDLRDVVYFVVISLAGILATEVGLARRWIKYSYK